jgi:hypothetical protein
VLPALILALAPMAPPTASASPSPPPRPLQTIVTVVSTPYCKALAEHFNSALVPMLANDRVFQKTGVQLDAMNEMFKYPDYANRFMDLRAAMLKETTVLTSSLRPIQQQIDRLRDSASLAKDPKAAQAMRSAADRLHDAYVHQFQLATDLTGLTQAMMNYDVLRGPHPLGGWTPYEQTLPADEKNIKVYLHFDQQRQSIGTGEEQAVDIAYTAAQRYCTTASPTPSPAPR